MAKVDMIEQSLMAQYEGRYSGLDIHSCCDYIGWLHRFKKLPDDRIFYLIDLALACMGGLTFDEEIEFKERYERRKAEINAERKKAIKKSGKRGNKR